MNKPCTIHNLVGETKQSLNTLEKIIDTLLMEYRIASEQINTEQDTRQGPLALLQELNDDLQGLVVNYSVFDIDNISKGAADVISAIAHSEERIVGRV
jgi:hypothetical protein